MHPIKKSSALGKTVALKTFRIVRYVNKVLRNSSPQLDDNNINNNQQNTNEVKPSQAQQNLSIQQQMNATGDEQVAQQQYQQQQYAKQNAMYHPNNMQQQIPYQYYNNYYPQHMMGPQSSPVAHQSTSASQTVAYPMQMQHSYPYDPSQRYVQNHVPQQQQQLLLPSASVMQNSQMAAPYMVQSMPLAQSAGQFGHVQMLPQNYNMQNPYQMWQNLPTVNSQVATQTAQSNQQNAPIVYPQMPQIPREMQSNQALSQSEQLAQENLQQVPDAQPEKAQIAPVVSSQNVPQYEQTAYANPLSHPMQSNAQIPQNVQQLPAQMFTQVAQQPQHVVGSPSAPLIQNVPTASPWNQMSHAMALPQHSVSLGQIQSPAGVQQQNLMSYAQQSNQNLPIAPQQQNVQQQMPKTVAYPEYHCHDRYLSNLIVVAYCTLSFTVVPSTKIIITTFVIKLLTASIIIWNENLAQAGEFQIIIRSAKQLKKDTVSFNNRYFL